MPDLERIRSCHRGCLTCFGEEGLRLNEPLVLLTSHFPRHQSIHFVTSTDQTQNRNFKSSAIHFPLPHSLILTSKHHLLIRGLSVSSPPTCAIISSQSIANSRGLHFLRRTPLSIGSVTQTPNKAHHRHLVKSRWKATGSVSI